MLLILKDGQNAVLLNTILIPLLLLKLHIIDSIEETTFAFQISLTYEKITLSKTVFQCITEMPEFKKYMNRKKKMSHFHFKALFT